MSQTHNSLNDNLHPSIPRVMCPSCGNTMRLAKLAPDPLERPIMEFDCACGYRYEIPAGLA